MKKTWEINASTIEDSIRIAIKQIQKFIEKRKLTPIALLAWEERSMELAVTLVFDDANDINVVDMAKWINEHKAAA